MSRVTITDLAKASGLSVCTINKALNGKRWVSEETRKRVLELADAMGYQPNRLAQALARRTLSLAVVYPQFWPQWFTPLVDGVRQGVEALQDYNINTKFYQVDGTPTDHRIAETVGAILAEGVDGLIICSGYSLGYTQDVAQRVADLPVVLLGGDDLNWPRLTCARADARRSGHIAAELLSLFTTNRQTAILVGERTIIDHREKIDGFFDEANKRQLPVVGAYETQDDHELAYEITARLFAEHPEIGGLYVATDTAEGVCRFLIEHDLARKVKVVGTGVFPAMRDLLAQGIVHASLFQSQQEQGRLAVSILYRFLTEQVRPKPETLVAPQLALNGNIDLLGV